MKVKNIKYKIRYGRINILLWQILKPSINIVNCVSTCDKTKNHKLYIQLNDKKRKYES